MNPITFYTPAEHPYGVFSNFARYGFVLDGGYWPTCEHYFQVQKFAGTPHAEAIRAAKTPKLAAQMGRDRKRPLRKDWEGARLDVMRQGVLCKFQTHAELRELLLSTGDAQIIENAPHDYFWGMGRMAVGKTCSVKS